MKIVIVGAGIVGSVIALELSENHEVVVLDRGSCPGQSGATGSTFSWINSVYKKPLNYHTINRDSCLLWSSFAEKLGITEIGFHQRGLYHFSAEEEVNDLRDIVSDSQSYGYPITQVISADEPYLKVGSIPVYFSPEDAIVDAQKVCQKCVELAVANGAKYVKNTEVVRLVKNDNDSRIIGALSKDEKFFASDICIVCAGTGTRNILQSIGVNLPLKPSASSHAMTEPLGFELLSNTSLALKRCNGERYHLKQDFDGSVRMGRGLSHQKIKWSERQKWAEDLRDEWAKNFPALCGVKVKCTLEGKRVKPEDGMPVIGFVDDTKTVYTCVTHSGVTLVPILKNWVKDEIEGTLIEKVKLHLEPYRISRFQQKHAKL